MQAAFYHSVTHKPPDYKNNGTCMAVIKLLSKDFSERRKPARDHRCGVGCPYCLLWLMGQDGSRGRIGHALGMGVKDEREGACKG